MSHGLEFNDPPARGPTFPNKKLIKSPFNMNFDDTPTNPPFQSGGNNSYSNPANDYAHQRNAPNPFATHQEDELSGNINLSGDQPRLIAKKMPAASVFVPGAQSTAAHSSSSSTYNTGTTNYELDENGDPPLLVDLGIDIQSIKQKTLAILTFKQCDEKFLEDADMAGPMMFALAFGGFLLLRGRVHFGYIYGFFVVGCLLIYTIMNFLSQEKNLELYSTVSILGYGLLPIVALSALSVVLSMQNWLGLVLGFGAVMWAAMTASKMVESTLRLSDKKWVIAYPIFLFYLVFVILAVF